MQTRLLALALLTLMFCASPARAAVPQRLTGTFIQLADADLAQNSKAAWISHLDSLKNIGIKTIVNATIKAAKDAAAKYGLQTRPYFAGWSCRSLCLTCNNSKP